MSLATIERAIVDYFEQIGCDVETKADGSDEWILNLLEQDDEISLTALAVEVHAALTRGKGI